jgi:excisionase family DNA binding protein
VLEDEMLTIDELASFLKLRPQTIYRWAQSGKIPGAKFGKEWRFRRSAIERWLESYIPVGGTGDGAGREQPGAGQKARKKSSATKPAAVPSATPVEPAGQRTSRARKRSRGPEAN